MSYYKHLLFFLASATMLISACTDPSLVGADLLDDDLAELGFTDTVMMRTTTQNREPLQTYSAFTSDQLEAYLFGTFADPVFGLTSAAINVQFVPFIPTGNADDVVNEADLIFNYTAIDSVRLVLRYSQDGFYGAPEGETFGMRVSELAEPVSADVEYLSDFVPEVKGNPLVEHFFTVSLDSITRIDIPVEENDTVQLDTVRFPHVSIPLPDEIGERLFEALKQDSSLFDNPDAAFKDVLPGFRLEPTTTNNGLVRFSLFPANTTIPGISTGLYVYYRDSEDITRRQLFPLSRSSSLRHSSFEHEYDGTLVEEFLGSENGNDSLFFVQGMAGVNGVIDLPDFEGYENVAVNYAELELTAVPRFTEGADSVYALPQQLVLVFEDEDGDILIPDLVATLPSRTTAENFGGTPLQPADPGEPVKYRFLLSTHLQEVIEMGVPARLKVYPANPQDISTFSTGETAARAVLYGGSHPEFAPRLRITFTRF